MLQRISSSIPLSPARRSLECDRVSVARLVASEFLQNPKKLPIVNHIDGDKKNNVPGNLEWCDNSTNQKHAYRLGLNKPILGENNPACKLSAKEIVQIKSMWESNTYTQAEIAMRFKVSRSHVSNIVLGIKRLRA